MMFIVETPHQLAPFCWVAEDPNNFIDVCLRLDQTGAMGDSPSYQTVVDWLRSDLSHLQIFDTVDAAAMAAITGEVGGHQAHKAHKALVRMVKRFAWEIEDADIASAFEVCGDES